MSYISIKNKYPQHLKGYAQTSFVVAALDKVRGASQLFAEPI